MARDGARQPALGAHLPARHSRPGSGIAEALDERITRAVKPDADVLPMTRENPA